MDRRAELLVSDRAGELYRQAERQRLLNAVARAHPRRRTTTATLGRLLILAGSRLEAMSARRTAPRAISFIPDPCGGCAD